MDLQLGRLACAFVAMTCGFSAVIHLPLAEASTLSFAKNFFVTILAIFFLGEVVGLRRWGAVTVGFIGVLIVLWPTGEAAFSIYGVMALVSAAAVAVVFIMIRKLAQVDRPITIMSYQAIGIGVLMIPPTIWFWQTPTWAELAMLGAIGVLSVIGQYCNIFALRVGEASALAPIDYTRLLMVLALGWWVFSEWPEDRVFVGAAIIIAAALYTLNRERKVGAVKTIGS